MPDSLTLNDLPTIDRDRANKYTETTKSNVLVRRRAADSMLRNAAEHERRRSGAVVMAIIAILLLLHRRISYDSWVILLAETIASVVLLAFAAFAARAKFGPLAIKVDGLLTCAALAVPWVSNPMAKQFGSGNGLEIVMLSSLGWGSLACAMLSIRIRTLGLSVVCSGFLTLFATFISDSPTALWFSLAWGILCLWWLVNNYWAQVVTTSASGIQPARVHRIIFTVLGCAIFLGGAFIVSDRVPILRKLQLELVPTSGGTSGKDSAARRGVGNGDALIAAKNHATSFGAVDTDVFLDSEQPSLFDVFSEEFGEPKKKLQRVERAQALSPQQIKGNDGSFTEANRAASSSEFSIDRELPADRKPVDDLVAESLMFWQGESGAHLAAQRFEFFDGSVWTTAEVQAEARGHSPVKTTHSLQQTRIGEQTWFIPGGSVVQNSISPFIDSLPEAIQFTRYRSPTIPTRQGMQLWSIDKIDRQDFFEITADDCLQMTDREHVPEYTAVRMINSRIDLERLDKLVRNCSPGDSHQELTDECRMELNRLAHDYAGTLPRSWQQVQSIIYGLRKNFELDRDRTRIPLDAAENTEPLALSQFLQHHRGPDYLFATAAALMLDHLGYRTRFVAGFYANPKNYNAREGKISILPSDAHAWLEIDVGHGYWIPLEPCPGFLEPRYSASIWYRIKELRWTIAQFATSFMALALCVFLLRRLLVEIASWIALPVLYIVSDRRRIAWLTWLLDVRCRFAGVPRSQGTVLREHLNRFRPNLSMDLGQQIGRYLESADQLWFGGLSRLSSSDLRAVSRVWRGLTIRALRRGAKRMAEGQSA